MSTPFKEDVRRCFLFLFEKWGFEFVDVADDFGGNIAVAKSGILRIRFIRDRADFFVDIGTSVNSERWTGFYKILDGLRAKGKVKMEYKYSNKMRAVSKLLYQCFLVIQESFLDQHNKA